MTGGMAKKTGCCRHTAEQIVIAVYYAETEYRIIKAHKITHTLRSQRT